MPLAWRTLSAPYRIVVQGADRYGNSGTGTGALHVASTTISFKTTEATPVNSGFAGFNSAFNKGVSYIDTNMTSVAQALGVGFIRWPGGSETDVFDLQTGLMRAEWAQDARFSINPSLQSRFMDTYYILQGMGGLPIDYVRSLATAVGSTGILVCVNAFTDSPGDAAAFARYAAARGTPVLGYELANEPYLFPTFFADAQDYLDKMGLYASAIRQGSPGAQVGVFLSDAGSPNAAWDDAVKNYPRPFWDFLSYHHYTPNLGSSSDEIRANLNEVLYARTSLYITYGVAPRFGNTPVVVSEFSPSDGAIAVGAQGKLYGGIWAAEYAMRMSVIPQVRRLGLHQLVNGVGIGMGMGHQNASDILDAGQQGTVIDSTKLDWQFFAGAEGVAYSVVANIINGATASYSTTRIGGGTVPRAAGQTMPALYAQAYQTGNQKTVLITNKSATNEVVRIMADGAAVAGNFNVTTATGKTPDDMNSYTQALVQSLRSTQTAVVSVPAYSVVQLSW